MAPSQGWYRAMNRLYVEERLDDKPNLRLKYGDEYSSFKQFFLLVMEQLGWPDINDAQEEYDNKTFYDLKFKRMYEIDVKKWRRISKVVRERDHFTCAYCGQVGGILEIDHVIPFSKGGSDELDNLVTSCRKCNRQKKDKTLNEFHEWRKANEQLFSSR